MTLLTSIARRIRPLVDRHPRAAMTYRHYRDLRDLTREPVATPFGFRLVGNRDMESGEFEAAETMFVRRVLRQADVLVNVGANIGYYCCFGLQLGKRVVAFEPLTANLRYLYRNVTANDWADAIEVHPVALGARPGLVEMYGSGTAASLVAGWAGIPLEYRQTVPLTTLDASLGERFAGEQLFIIVDIEGAELGMLQGAAAVLAREPKPVWMVEISIDEHQPNGARINAQLEATFAVFERAGYGVWQIGATIERLAYSHVRRIASSGVNTLSTHNFAFASARHDFGRG